MSRFRCFENYNQHNNFQDSSNKTQRLKQTTLYSNIANNAAKWKNKKYSKTKITDGGCLINTDNHETLLDLTKGNSYCNSRDSLEHIGDAWQGNFTTVRVDNLTTVVAKPLSTNDYSLKNNRINIADWPNIPDAEYNNLQTLNNVVDPKYCLFYSPCIYQSKDPYNKYAKYINFSEYTNTKPYNAIFKNKINNIQYPSPIKFAIKDPVAVEEIKPNISLNEGSDCNLDC